MAVVVAVTAVVVTAKVAVVLPALTVTLAGTVAEGLLLTSATVMPPVGAAALTVNVPAEELPPVTDVGVSERADNDTAGLMVSSAVSFTEL